MKRSRNLWLFTIIYTLVLAGVIEFSFQINNRSGSASLLVLSVSDKIQESLVLDRLSAAAVHHVISESTQWVYIDDFVGPRAIPLKNYYDYIEPLDPRNDGYADQLKSIFLSDGMRHYFIPLSGLNPWSSQASLLRRLEKSLADLNPSFQLSETSHTQVPWWLTGLVLSGLFVYSFITFKEKREILLSIPAGIIFISLGIGGILCTGLLVALQICISQFQKDLISQQLRKVPFSLRHFFHWYQPQVVYSAILLVIYSVSGLVFSIHWFLLLAALIVQGATGSLFTLIRLNYFADIGHTFFLPIELIGSVKKHMEPLKSLVPFSLGALAAFLFFIIIPGRNSVKVLSRDVPPIPVTFEQYKAHIEIQSHFSIRALYHESSSESSYNTYMLGSDGLLAKVQPAVIEDAYKNLEVPPLESLLSVNFSNPIHQDTIGQGLYLVIFISGVSFLIYRASHGTLLLANKSVYIDKRIAA
ncbi:MAG: hypothetical protein ACOZCE_07145 [Spirochaetota bacterium]